MSEARDKQIKGFKTSEFVEPEKVFGEDVDRAELPEGVRYYMRKASFDPAKHKAIVNLYELRDVPGELKVDKVHLEKLNFIPDEEYIGLNFGPNKDGYVWIGKLKSVEGGQVDMLSETIFISEKWRRRYEEHQRKLDAKAEAGSGPSVNAAALAPAPAAGVGPVDMIKLIQAGEDRALNLVKTVAEIFNKKSGDAMPADILSGAYKGAMEIMEKAVQTNVSMARTIGRAAEDAITGAGDDQAAGAPAGGPDAAPTLPPWLDALMPTIKGGIDRLLGGGPVAGAVKSLILSSDEWKEIFADKTKFGQAVAAMEAHFGSDKTERALDVLLNRRKKKK